MKLRTAAVATAVGGALLGPDVEVDGATIDSRTVGGGELFVPLVGQRDGHDFVDQALAAGAGAYLTARGHRGGTAVAVEDTAAALLDLGRHARSRLPDRVVGVTGSVGKTTVKDLLAAALAARWRTAASVRSFNNELGVPLTLLNAPDDTEAAVVEMGARGPRHIRLLCSVARPTVGVVTVVAAVHTETFGSVEAVAAAKQELVEDLPASGTAVLNAADPLVRAMARATPARVLRYGEGEGDVRAEGVTLDDELRPRFRVRTPWGDADVRVPVRGQHQVGNALAAVAAALACGVEVEAAVAGLAAAVSSPWRMDLRRAPSGALVLNDAYNANPTSTAAALRSLASLRARRHLAFLGTMAELGATSDDDHRRVAALGRELGVRVVAVGEPAYGGEVVADVEEAAALAVAAGLAEGDAVLVKGSRVAGLERLAAALLAP